MVGPVAILRTLCNGVRRCASLDATHLDKKGGSRFNTKTMSTVKATFKQIAERNTGRILIMRYGTAKQGEKYLVFSPIPPKDSTMKCGSCGWNIWNATNFSNDIHFCPNREIEVEITDYKSVFHR